MQGHLGANVFYFPTSSTAITSIAYNQYEIMLEPEEEVSELYLLLSYLLFSPSAFGFRLTARGNAIYQRYSSPVMTPMNFPAVFSRVAASITSMILAVLSCAVVGGFLCVGVVPPPFPSPFGRSQDGWRRQ